MYTASQLTEISSRFPAHVEDLREFLVKEKLAVPSPEALPELASRLETDARFRADVGSLLRATLYREREQVGYEDLLGILVAAAAGTKDDLKSESQESDIRNMLRFVLQSRRATFHVDPEEETAAVQAEAREAAKDSAVQPEPVAVAARAAKAEPLHTKPLLVREHESAAQSKKLELRADEPAVAVAEMERREPDDVVLTPFRTTGLFAAHTEVETSWWRAHPAWIAGVICLLVGIALGLILHLVVSAAETQVAARAASSKPEAGMSVAARGNAATSNTLVARNGSAAPQPVNRQRNAKAAGGGITETPIGTDQPATATTASAAGDDKTAVKPAAPLEGRAFAPTSAPPATTALPSAALAPASAEKTSGVPVTVVKQVVTSSPSGPDSGAPGATQLTAATRSIVHQGGVGMKAANVIFSPAPEYPPAAAAARVHGQVTVHAVVDPDGNVIYARAVSGPPQLRDAAQEAVHKWRYSPLLDNGKPIAVTTVAILDFKVAR